MLHAPLLVPIWEIYFIQDENWAENWPFFSSCQQGHKEPVEISHLGPF